MLCQLIDSMSHANIFFLRNNNCINRIYFIYKLFNVPLLSNLVIVQKIRLYLFMIREYKN